MGNGFSAASVPELPGKRYLITGANTGIGFETTYMLACRGAAVHMACRSKERCETAITKLRVLLEKDGELGKAGANGLCFHELDLGSMRSTEQSARALLAAASSNEALRFDAIIANAGIMMCPYKLTPEGLESQFGVNHVAHFVFVGLLLPLLRQKESRVIILTSIAHQMAPKETAEKMLEAVRPQPKPAAASPEVPPGEAQQKARNEDPGAKSYSAMQYYARSKLCNLLFAAKLARLRPDLLVYGVHPGYVKTELSRSLSDTYGSVFGAAAKVMETIGAMDSKKGALTSVYALVCPQDSGPPSGSYLVPIAKKSDPTAWSQKTDLQDSVFELTISLVRELLGEDAAAEMVKNMMPR